jgi:hypothetical protein
VLAHGLEQLSPVPNEVYRYILDFLARNPSPEEIRAFRPTAQMQERISALLDKNRSNQLTAAESSELDEYERIEHVIRIRDQISRPLIPRQMRSRFSFILGLSSGAIIFNFTRMAFSLGVPPQGGRLSVYSNSITPNERKNVSD